MIRLLRSLYFTNRLMVAVGVVVGVFVVSYLVPFLLGLAKGFFLLLLAALVTDLLLLYRAKKGLLGYRVAPDRLSNGDDNEIRIHLESFYIFPIRVNIIDEAPFIFQRRDLGVTVSLARGASKTLMYMLRPVKRGTYGFGDLNAFVDTPLGLLQRRFRFPSAQDIPVYPSFLLMKHYEMIAISNRLVNPGIKRVRRIGHNAEFEMVREYVAGDDVRTLNWKATARRTVPMVNQYQDERSQQVYSLIDKGRTMEMPFLGMSLLDYAINAAVVFSNIALRKYDKPGLLTFQDRTGIFLPASSRSNQSKLIMEALYREKTGYRESDFSNLYIHTREKISQRSLLLLFTNFESHFALRRQMPFLSLMARRHVLVVIFFENTELSGLIHGEAPELKDIYYKAVGEKFSLEKKTMVAELNRRGIQAILTTPEKLTINTINKYLELKARGMI